MAEILSVGKIARFCKSLKKKGEKIVLAGGCFDILHPGHVVFLEKAKKAGDILMVMLESDKKVRQLKGPNHPVHTQQERAVVLSALKAADYVLLLPYLGSDAQYDDLIGKIRPDVIAVSSKDASIAHHQRAAKLAGARLKLVTRVIGNYSTTWLLTCS